MKIIVEFDTEKDDVVGVDQCLSGPKISEIVRDLDSFLRATIKNTEDSVKAEHYQQIRTYLRDAVNDEELHAVIFE